MSRVIGVLVAIAALAAIVAVGALVMWPQIAPNLPGASTSASAQSANASSSASDTPEGALGSVQFTLKDETDETPPYLKPERINKLAGATETTDENGIVHGVTPDGIAYVLYGRGEQGASRYRVTLAAVGDVIGTESNFPLADSYAGGRGDGWYSYVPYYQEVGPQITAHDLRFINQETPCAGSGRGYSGYPIFNSPDAIIEGFAYTGFNIVNFGSNHTWDMGVDGILRTHELLAQYPGIMSIGSYNSQEERETVHMVERNGTTFAFLSYLYGDNWYGYNPDNYPNTYYSCPFDMNAMHAEIERARAVADCVIVYMHWGSEYNPEPDSMQWEYAQFLADEGVDLVIGSHAHILQPIRYVTGANGNRLLVVFGLSDFISGWTLTDTILSGIFSCDFVWLDGVLQIENAQFTPAIEWQNGGEVYVRFLKDMTYDEINSNWRTEDVSNDADYLRTFIDNLRMEVPVVW